MFFPQSSDDQKLLKVSYLTLRKTSNTGRLVMNSWWGRALWRCRWLHTYYIHFSKLLVSSCVQKVSLSSCSFSHSSICLAHSPGGAFWVQMSLAEMDHGIKQKKPSVLSAHSGKPSTLNDQQSSVCTLHCWPGCFSWSGTVVVTPPVPPVTATAQPFIPAAAADTWTHLPRPDVTF